MYTKAEKVIKCHTGNFGIIKNVFSLLKIMDLHVTRADLLSFTEDYANHGLSMPGNNRSNSIFKFENTYKLLENINTHFVDNGGGSKFSKNYRKREGSGSRPRNDSQPKKQNHKTRGYTKRPQPRGYGNGSPRSQV